MARRRLLTILATTTVLGGLSAAPALAGPLDGVTGGLEDAVTTVTEQVEEVTDEVVGSVTGGGAGIASDEDDPSTLDLGTGDGTLDVDLDVDVAPSDEDGSPQLEIDGGVTIADQEVDLGTATDPIEDAVDPDPPAPSPTASPTTTDGGEGDTREPAPAPPAETGGGFLPGGGVVAASTNARPLDGGGTTGATGQGHAALGALDRGTFGVRRHGDGAVPVDRVPDPEVAPPLSPPAERSVDPAVVAGDTETPAVLATGPGAADEGAVPGLLRVIAAAMVLGTGAVWMRAVRRA